MEPIVRNDPAGDPVDREHRRCPPVLHFSAERNVASATGERLMRAHFTEGADLSDPGTRAD